MDLLIALASGFTLGCLHAFDADHIAAVSALASRTRRAVAAMRLGITWGLGHSFVLLVVGGTIVMFRLSVPTAAQEWAEILVGVLLIGLGAWTLVLVRRDWHQHVHRHAHDGSEHLHIHAHEGGDHHEHEHRHRHSMLVIGAAHGLAGTGAVGFEALSRGAARVVFIEQDGKLIGALSANAKRLEVHEE
ncbi:MAG: RsmD family RNA methyltransferase, partial [Bacteroidota bacterium]